MKPFWLFPSGGAQVKTMEEGLTDATEIFCGGAEGAEKYKLVL